MAAKMAKKETNECVKLVITNEYAKLTINNITTGE